MVLFVDEPLCLRDIVFWAVAVVSLLAILLIEGAAWWHKPQQLAPETSDDIIPLEKCGHPAQPKMRRLRVPETSLDATPSQSDEVSLQPVRHASDGGGRALTQHLPLESGFLAPDAGAGRRPWTQSVGPSPDSSAPLVTPSLQLLCGICLEYQPSEEMLCSSGVLCGDGGSTSSSDLPSDSCGHLYCRPCMQQYIHGLVRTRRWPLRCAAPDCREAAARSVVQAVLSDLPGGMELYESLEVENSISYSQRVYCPYSDCSAPMARQEQASAAATCSTCRRDFCITCQIPGVHEGMTCEEFQLLPAHLRSAEDAALLHMSSQHKWRQCPTCGQLVERIDGCNHIHCQCGADFCYACGAKYLDQQANEHNPHGTPGCMCRLFDAIDFVDIIEDDDDEEAMLEWDRIQQQVEDVQQRLDRQHREFVDNLQHLQRERRAGQPRQQQQHYRRQHYYQRDAAAQQAHRLELRDLQQRHFQREHVLWQQEQQRRQERNRHMQQWREQELHELQERRRQFELQQQWHRIHVQQQQLQRQAIEQQRQRQNLFEQELHRQQQRHLQLEQELRRQQLQRQQLLRLELQRQEQARRQLQQQHLQREERERELRRRELQRQQVQQQQMHRQQMQRRGQELQQQLQQQEAARQQQQQLQRHEQQRRQLLQQRQALPQGMPPKQEVQRHQMQWEQRWNEQLQQPLPEPRR